MQTKHFVAISLLAMSLTATAQTNTITVVDYLPAPGQFVNEIPKYKEGYNQDSMNVAASKSLNDGQLIHLGTYGGYVAFKFDHPIKNIGKDGRGSELLIEGNGFYAARSSDSEHPAWGGSIEPGIVYVGVGDDYKTCKWYELAGSMYHSKGLQITSKFYCEPEIHDFTITYHKPLKEKADSASERKQRASALDKYVRWECSWTKNGERVDSTGYHMKNSFHKQSYWPQWISDTTLTFSGSKLPNNAVDESGKGTYWVQYRYGANSYGYVDGAPNNYTDSPLGDGTNPENTFDIDWAVDADGNYVHLDEINFVKVVSGTFQYCGWLGETSTEIQKVEDLTLRDGYTDNPIIVGQSEGWSTGIGSITINKDKTESKAVYNLMGQRVSSLQPGHVYIRGGHKFIAR